MAALYERRGGGRAVLSVIFALLLLLLLVPSSCFCGGCHCGAFTVSSFEMSSRSLLVSFIGLQSHHYTSPRRCSLSLDPILFPAFTTTHGKRCNPSRILTSNCRISSIVKRRWFCYLGKNSNDSNYDHAAAVKSNNLLQLGPGTHILLWRGEGTKGYSLQFRQLEFSNAVSAVLLDNHHPHSDGLKKFNAITVLDDYSQKKKNDVVKYLDATSVVDRLDDRYGAMQYVQFIHTTQQSIQAVPAETPEQFQLIDEGQIFQEATKRCGLVREIYSVIAVGDSYEQLAHEALKSQSKTVIARLMKKQDADATTSSRSSSGSMAQNDTASTKSLSWCVRFREYDNQGSKRFGVSKRSSMKKERQVIDGLKPLLQEFRGPVRLKDPDCTLYVFQGLTGSNLLLVEKVASGASTQVIAPNTRHCITNTPLCPLSSFIMCNAGRIKGGDRILDPYSGSCSTLLACAIIAPTTQTVGIELVDDKVIDRGEINADFTTRGLVPPVGLIHGDCTDCGVRALAQNAIGGGAFDVILADPPYGRREKISKGESRTPLQQLVECIRKDAESNRPLLRKGGRLVVFVPTSDGENLVDNLPSKSELAGAGLNMISQTEQPLSLTLSRWLIVFEQE